MSDLATAGLDTVTYEGSAGRQMTSLAAVGVGGTLTNPQQYTAPPVVTQHVH